jgi:radical SAM protein with 4Fe4S-binding SPASM domain
MNAALWKDRFRIASTLTPRRAWNSVKITAGFYWSRFTHRPVHWGMPSAVSIEPTTSCNLRCPECPSGLRSFSRPTGMLNDDLYKKVIGQLSKDVSYITFYFQGEPYLNRRFLDMVSYAASRKIYTSTSTNAHYLDDATARKTVESGLHRLIISIDGTTQDVYEQYRIGGKLEKVIEGTKNILRWKKELRSATPHVIFQFLVVRPNEHQVSEVQQLAEELGVDEVRFKTAQVYDFENGNPLIPETKKYSRYKRNENGSYTVKNKLDDHCWKMWSSCVITWDGKVVPCCFDKDAQHQLGDLQTDSFREIWNSERYKNFRNQLFASRKSIDICANCSEGTKVWA